MILKFGARFAQNENNAEVNKSGILLSDGIFLFDQFSYEFSHLYDEKHPILLMKYFLIFFIQQNGIFLIMDTANKDDLLPSSYL